MMKSNPIPPTWVIHKLENNNTEEVLPLLWRLWTPCQASQLGDMTKGLGIPGESDLEGQWDLITRLPQAWGKQTPVLEGTNKTLYTPRLRGKRRTHRRLNQIYLLVLEGLLWRHGLAGAHHRDRGTGSSSLGRSPLQETLLEDCLGAKHYRRWSVKNWSESCSVMSDSVWPHGLYNPWNSLG